MDSLSVFERRVVPRYRIHIDVYDFFDSELARIRDVILQN